MGVTTAANAVFHTTVAVCASLPIRVEAVL